MPNPFHCFAGALCLLAASLPVSAVGASAPGPGGPSPSGPATAANGNLPTRVAVLDAAREAAAAYWAVQPQAITLREPDARLRPPACASGFRGQPAPGTSAPGRVTIEVSCPGNRPGIGPGMDSGMAWRTFLSARLAEPLATPAGNALAHKRPSPSHRAPALVKRGTPVTISAGTPAFQVLAEGIALADGALGAMVRVRNLGTGKEVTGTVVGAGQVALPFASPTMQGIPQVAATAVDNTSVGQLARRGDDK